MFLQEHESGINVADLARKHGISDHTIYRWKSEYGGMELNDMQCMKQLEDENRRLESLVADQALDIQGLKAVLSKKC